MDASRKTKRELVEQVRALRSHLEELERGKIKHKQMEEAIKESEEHARIFASYQHTISELREFYVREANLEQMLQKTADLIVKDFGYYMAWYGELKVDEKVIIPKVWAGKYEKYLDGLRLELDDSKDAKCAMSIAIVKRKPFGYADLEHDKDFEKWRPLAVKYGYRSNQAIPLIIDGKSIGAFLIYSTRPRAFSETLIQYLMGIANELAMIVENITKRKRAGETSRESEEKYRKLFEETADPIFVADVETGVLVDCNTAATELVGRKKTELIGKHQRTLHPPEEIEGEFSRTFKQHLMEKEGQVLEAQVITKKGKIKDVAIRASRFELKGRKRIQAMFRDVTERKKTEDALARSKREWENTFNAISEWVVLMDLEGRILRTNRIGEKFTGVPLDEIVWQSICKLVHGSEKHIPGCPLLKMLETGQRASAELQVPDTDQWMMVTVDPVTDEEGEIIGAVHIARDITERKKAEEERVAAVQERAAVIDAMSDALIVLNLDGEIISSNPAYLQMLGLNSVNEVSGRHFSELRELFCDPEENIPRSLELFKGLIENGSGEPAEIRIRRADGKELTVSASGSLQRDAMGNPKNVVAILRDITQHKRLEEVEKEAAVTRMAVEMIEGMLESVTIMDLDGTIRQVNSEFERGSGWKREEAVGKTAIELGVTSKTEWQRIEKEIIPKLMNEGSVQNIETVVIRKDGTKFPALMSWTLAKDAEGKPKSIITVARDITERKQAEERLIEYQEHLRSLASELSLTEERERRSIATELHDRIGQDLALSMLKLDSLRKSPSSDVLAAPLDEISNLLEKAIQDTRSLTFNLSSPILYKFGFERAIAEWLMEQIQKRYGIRAEFEDDGRPKPLEEDICVLLFQATRELLINVVRHAQARSVKVSIRRKGGEIETIVEDDGVGLDLSKIGTVALTNSRFGLFSIRERLNYLGGHLKIESKPGHGTRVTLMAPLKTKKEAPGED